MANLWKQVVFDLMIQTTTHPREQARTCAKVCRGFELVREVVIFHACAFFPLGKLQVFQHVSRLEDGGQDESCYGVHDHPAQDDFPKRKAAEERRQDYDVAEV